MNGFHIELLRIYGLRENKLSGFDIKRNLSLILEQLGLGVAFGCEVTRLGTAFNFFIFDLDHVGSLRKNLILYFKH